MKNIYVVGHRNPDTDSICSSIGLSYFMNKIDKNKENKYVPKRTGKINPETKFILQRFKVKKPTLISDLSNKNIILVDHNSFNDSVKGAQKANIVRVIDHHRISGDINTDQPIMFENQAVGSTCTIITEKFFDRNMQIPKDIAGVLLGGILSDTILLKSPNTRNIDKLAVKYLSKKAEIDYKKFGKELIEKNTKKISKSDIKEIVSADLKIFKKYKTNFGIGSVNISNDIEIKKLLTEILKEMEKQRKKLKLNTLFLMCVNIHEFQTTLLIVGDSHPYKKLLNGKEESILKNTVSRKSQVYPLLVDSLEEYLNYKRK